MARKRPLSEQREKGIFPHHSRSCDAKGWDDAGVCTCDPSFQPEVWSKELKRPVKGPKSPTLAAARGWRIDALHDKKRGKLRMPIGTTFSEAADAFLAGMRDGTIRNRKKQSYKPSVIRTYETWIDARLRPEFGTNKLSNITHLDIQDFVDELVAEGLSGQTVKNIVIPMQAIYKRAAKREGIINVTRDLDLPASTDKRGLVASPPEAAAMVEALDALADRAFWALLFYAGLRWGEAADLDVSDIGAWSINVDSSWDREEGSGDPKSAAGERVIPKCEHLARFVDPYVESLDHDSGFLFPGETDKEPLDYGKARRRAEAAWKDANLPRLSPRRARTSFRTWLDASPISDTRADRYMGHAATHVRSRYIDPPESQLREDAVALDEYLTAHETGNVIELRRVS
jgi:integrase